MTTHWERVRIGELGRVVTGRTPPTVHPEYFGGEYPFVTPSDMLDQRTIHETERGVSNAGAKILGISKLLPARSVAVSCIGWQMGRVMMTSRPSYTNQQLNSIIPNERVVPEYLHYHLTTLRDYFMNLGSVGTRTPILNKSRFEEIELVLPPLPIQLRIASILSAYDDLIENNTQRIKALEAAAQTLYREWFVEFRFPGWEQVEWVEGIPEGWQDCTIAEAFEITGGGTPSTKNAEYWNSGSINWYAPSDLTAVSNVFMPESPRKITELGLRNSSARMFPAYSVMMTSRATIGVTAINTTEACTNQGFITCIPNDRVSAYQIYFWIADHLEQIDQVASGATFKEIIKSNFKQFHFLIAESEINSRFIAAVEPIFRLIENLEVRTAALAETRDLLLPRLISGELSVEGLPLPQAI